jgi:formiminoglutamase
MQSRRSRGAVWRLLAANGDEQSSHKRSSSMATPSSDGMFGIPHLRPPGLEVRASFEDRHEPRIPNWFTTWDGESPLDVGVVMAGLSTTSILPTSCYSAPNAFRLSHPQFTTFSPDYDVDIQTMRVRDLGDIRMPILDPIRGLANIQECLRGAFELPQQPFIVVIGGDHAVTAPSFRAFCQANPALRVGLIHFDAHNDVRVMDHGPPTGHRSGRSWNPDSTSRGAISCRSESMAS